MKSSLGLACSALVIVLVLSSASCERLFGRRAEVVFRTVDGVRSGDAVYLHGIRIGTTGTPFLRAGSAVVPLYIGDLSVLPTSGIVFLSSTDLQNPNRKRLVGFPRPPAYAAASPPRVYQGVSGELELVLLVGADYAQRLLGERDSSIQKLLQRIPRN